jgi:two-component system sensor histidine kinase/response regulator
MTRAPPARLLIVDDEIALLNALCRVLQAQGYLTTGAESGRSALSILRSASAHESGRFDVLITDLKMPDMDGIALLRAAHEIDAEMVSIVMTGHGTIDSAVEAMKGGALDYLLKPFNLSLAIPVLSRALNVRTLRKENAVLLQQVSRHTAELEAANRELRSANKELEAFTHSVSHDLRQPLNHVIGFSELLISDKLGQLNAEQREFLGNIHGGGVRMLRLTEDLLRFSRLGQQALQKQVLDMEALIRDVFRPLQAAEMTRSIELHMDPLPCASGDPSLLRQVWVNLLGNAVKFTRRVAHPKIDISAERRPGEVSYCIRDNGAGFDMAKLPRLFSIFQRLHSDSDFEGTGVGLSIVQRIIERHGGTISAQAEVGKGAAFTFTLPI